MTQTMNETSKCASAAMSEGVCPALRKVLMSMAGTLDVAFGRFYDIRSEILRPVFTARSNLNPLVQIRGDAASESPGGLRPAGAGIRALRRRTGVGRRAGSSLRPGETDAVRAGGRKGGAVPRDGHRRARADAGPAV